MGDSIKKFTPYKKILLNNEVSCLDSPCRKRTQPPDESVVTPPKSKRTAELQASSSSDSPSPKVSKKKKDKRKKLNAKEPKLKSKNNKENNTMKDVVIVEDSNDGMSVNSVQSDDFVIILDTNSNVKVPSKSPSLSCNLDGNVLNSFSTTKTFGSSKSPGSISINCWNSVQNSSASNSVPWETRTVKRQKSENPLDKLLAKASMLPVFVDITEDQLKPFSSIQSSNSSTSQSKSNISIFEVDNSKPNASDVPSHHNVNTTITLDDSIVVRDSSQASASDVLFIDSHISKPHIQQTKPDDSIIIDLEVIPSNSKSKDCTALNAEPLIVYDKSKETSQTKPSNSLAEWQTIPTPLGSLTPEFLPLSGQKTKRKKEKKKQKHPRRSERLKHTPKRLSKIEFGKLLHIRKTIVEELGIMDQRSSQPTAVSMHPSQTPAFNTYTSQMRGVSMHTSQTTAVSMRASQTAAGTSTMSGPFSTDHFFNPLTQRSVVVDGNQSRYLLEVPGNPTSEKSAPTARAKLDNNNIYNPAGSTGKKTGLRPIIIDGSNVAIEFLKYTDPSPVLKFNAKGIQIVVDYFKRRGHKEIHVFIPTYRAHHPNTLFPEILEKLKNEGILHHTPSRRVDGRLQCAYDDRYIVQVACELDGVIVSNDRYRDLMEENAKWKSTIEQRLLLFNFVGELLIFPQDPLGRNGPNLDTFLSF